MGFAEAIERNKADIICGGFCSYNEKATVKFAQAVECGLYDKKCLEEKIYDRMLFEEPYYTFGIFPFFLMISAYRYHKEIRNFYNILLLYHNVNQKPSYLNLKMRFQYDLCFLLHYYHS